jgi:hypothetical protein
MQKATRDPEGLGRNAAENGAAAPEIRHQTDTRLTPHSIATSAYRPTPPFLWLLEPSWPKIEGIQNTRTRAHPTEYLHKGLDLFAA